MKIIVYPDPFLKKKTVSVKAFDKKLQKTVRKMFDMMYKENGVGLAANQIGVPYNIVVINPTKKKADEIIMVNPKITNAGGIVCEEEEGCLSVPGLAAKVKRFTKVSCEFHDLEGKKLKADIEGLLARVAQHEIDHLNGILFIDRLPEGEREVLIKKYLSEPKPK